VLPSAEHRHTPARSENRLISTVGWRVGERTDYALEGSVFIGGAVVQWLRDGLGLIARSTDVEPLAASVPDNGGVYLVPAFAGLGAPHWDQYARGTIVGSRGGRPAGTSLGPRSRASPTKSATCFGVIVTPGSRSRNCGWMAAPPRTTCSCSFRPICSAFRSCGRP